MHQWRRSSVQKNFRFAVFNQNLRFQKMVLFRRTNKNRKTVPTPGSLQWWAALACAIAAWIFGKLAEWEQKISLMRLVLLDKNCSRQNGIFSEPRRLEKWFVYLTTFSRETNFGAVEQHGLENQWRSSSGPKKERFAILTKNRDSKKMVLRTNEREQEKEVYPWQFAVVSSTGLCYSSMDFREVGWVGAKN